MSSGTKRPASPTASLEPTSKQAKVEVAQTPVFELNVLHWLRNNTDHSRNNNRNRSTQSPPVVVQEPQEIACYSVALDKIHYGSREQLHRYQKPALKTTNLGDKIDEWIQSCDNDKPLVETILDALTSDQIANADVITFRNNLNKIGGTIFNPKNDWELECTLLDDDNNKTLYLDVLPGNPPQEPPPKDSLQYKLQYYGYRFESVCTGQQDAPVDNRYEFCSVLRLNMGDTRIVLAAEMDATTVRTSTSTTSVRDYVELKTMRPIRGDRDLQSLYRYRYPKYWLQSYLAGIPTIVVGERTDEGQLVDVRSVPVSRMHGEALSFFRGDDRKCWNPQTVIRWIHHVLGMLKSVCLKHPHRTIHVQYKGESRQIVGYLRDDDDGTDVIGKRLLARQKNGTTGTSHK
ncbi:Decapping and exoribonuclease protein [Seminavis robusta]|uniref:Decapping nuclease n=1 Tax=Seminavis robusta TaxID=568900 RepID=A0A9N8EDW9_9STRA|nr:Decapping and exoribonuclease protein [Seminavis robusta]|eukprot:Sro934_g221920.1 Decapping and exoribonuclease protein (403) ;mRNA; f:35393-36601